MGAAINANMIFDWNTILVRAIATLPTLHREIVVHTMQLPGKRRRVQYTEAARIWNLDREAFDRHRDSAFDALRLYLLRHGLSAPADLVLR